MAFSFLFPPGDVILFLSKIPTVQVNLFGITYGHPLKRDDYTERKDKASIPIKAIFTFIVLANLY